MDFTKLCFYEEISPKSGQDYFNECVSDIATVTVFYNEEGFTLQKTMSSLRLQQLSKGVEHNLLLVGDGLEQMASTMADILGQIFDPITLPITVEEWPSWANVCVVNLPCSKTFWPCGRISLILKKHNQGKWNSHEWHLKSFVKDGRFCFLTIYYSIHNFVDYSKF